MALSIYKRMEWTIEDDMEMRLMKGIIRIDTSEGNETTCDTIRKRKGQELYSYAVG